MSILLTCLVVLLLSAQPLQQNHTSLRRQFARHPPAPDRPYVCSTLSPQRHTKSHSTVEPSVDFLNNFTASIAIPASSAASALALSAAASVISRVDSRNASYS